MAAVMLSSFKQIGKTLFSLNCARNIALSSVTRLKEIIERKEGDTLIIEGVYRNDKYEKYLLKPKGGACRVCSSGLDIKHTDVLILSQFVRSDGCMLPRRITGLCNTQQRRIGIMVSMAQKAGLMPNLAPIKSRKDPTKRRQWRKFNTYFDESTIPYKL